MDNLTEKHFAFKCPMNWDDMEVSGSGRHCLKCQKQVFDLTNCSIDEVIALQKKHGPICGSIKVVAAVALSLSAAACQSTVGKIVSPARSLDGDLSISRNTIDGVILPPEQLERMRKR